MLIPRIFHQIWVGPNPFPEEFAAYQQTWVDHHPDWELRFWTEENLPTSSELRRPEVAERLRAPWERADILRLEVVWRHGGVHVDTDFECLRPIEPLIVDNCNPRRSRRARGRSARAAPNGPPMGEVIPFKDSQTSGPVPLLMGAPS